MPTEGPERPYDEKPEADLAAGATQNPLLQSLGYVPGVARHYLGRGLDLDELVGAGNLGLVEAFLRFDPARQVKFLTYADWWVRKAIREAVAAQAGPVRVPRYQHERLRRIWRSRNQLRLRHGVEPTTEELADEARLTRDEVDDVLRHRPVAASLDAPTTADGSRVLGETLEDPHAEEPQATAVRRELVARMLQGLAALGLQEQRVIQLRYGLWGEPPRTLREAGRLLGISRERVRQVERRVLDKLRARL